LVLASSGAGKTVLVAHALLREILASRSLPPEQQPSTFVIDPKGDLALALRSAIAAEAPELLSAVRYLDPFGAEGFPYNLTCLERGTTPIEIRALQIAHLVANTSSGGVGVRQVDLLHHLILGALSVPQPASLLLALDALVLPAGMARLGAVTESERAKQFLATAKINEELRQSTSTRLRMVLGIAPEIERLFTADRCIQFADLLGPGRVTIADLGRPTGGLTALQTFFANSVCRLVIESLLERPSPWDGHHCRLVVDEAQIVAPVLADPAELLLTTGRSRGLSLTLLSQGTALLDAASPTLLSVILSNTPLKFIGRLNAPDAERLAREQAPIRGIDESLAATRAAFISAVTNSRDREWYRLTPGGRERFHAVPIDVAAWSRASAKHARDLADVRRRLALPRRASPRVTLEALTADAPVQPRRRATASKRRGAPVDERVDEPPDAVPPPKPRSRWG
jgi:hypothetical protein